MNKKRRRLHFISELKHNKFWIYLPFIIGCISLIYLLRIYHEVREVASLRIYHEVREVASDGSLLFYNGPIYAKNDIYEYIAYLDRFGKNWLQDLNSGERLLVHDYFEQTRSSQGLSDDHAAPAIISVNTDEIFYATAYHGSELHIYIIKAMKIVEHTVIPGHYTYPRLLKLKGEVLLIVRDQPEGKNQGDLVVFRSSDRFQQKFVLMSSKPNEVIYAALPFIDDDKIIVTYALHKRKDRSMRDFYIAFFDKNFAISQKCDLGFLVEGAFYNRPTAVAKRGPRVLLGTSWFDESSFLKAQQAIYSQKNTVVIVEGVEGDCDSFHKIYERTVLAPYYNTDVSINKNLDFVFFGQKTYFSNINLGGCFLRGNNIYPRFVGPSMLLFARMNGDSYKIRNFDNSLYYCRANIGIFH